MSVKQLQKSVELLRKYHHRRTGKIIKWKQDGQIQINLKGKIQTIPYIKKKKKLKNDIFLVFLFYLTPL